MLLATSPAEEEFKCLIGVHTEAASYLAGIPGPLPRCQTESQHPPCSRMHSSADWGHLGCCSQMDMACIRPGCLLGCSCPRDTAQSRHTWLRTSTATCHTSGGQHSALKFILEVRSGASTALLHNRADDQLQMQMSRI